MFEGIKVLNAGKEIDLSKFEINVNNEIIIGNLNSLKIYVENGAKYSPAQLQVLENGNDVKIALEDSEGNDIFLILKGLNKMLLTNPNELPVFEVFDEGIQLASFVNVEDLDAAAAGGDTTSASQTEDFTNANPASIGNDVEESGGNLDGFNRVGNADALNLDQNYQPVVFDVTLSENEVLGVHEAGDKNIITGQFLVTDQNPEDTGLHTFSIVEGTVVITSSSGVITQIDDEIEITLNPDGTYEISGDFNDLAFGENATISFDYTATDPRGFESLPATFTLNIVGTNDQPVVEDIDLNNKLGEDFIGYEPFDGSGYLLSFTTNDLGEANFTWSFNTNETSNDKDEFNDFAFYYLLKTNIEEINDFPKPSFLFNAEMTNSNGESGEKSTLLSDLTPNTQYFLAFVIADDSDTAVASQFNFLGMDVPFVLIEGEGEFTIKDDNSFILSTGSDNTGFNISNLLNNVHGQYDKKIFETSDSNIEDTNENGILRDEDGKNIFKGVLSVSDDDNTDIHTFHVEEGSLEIEAAIELNDVSVEIKQDESGNWIYEINGDFTNLADGQKALVTFQYYADDGNIDPNGESNESERATISLEIIGTNDQPVVQDVDLGTINEATLTNKVLDIAPSLVNPSENDTFFEDSILKISSTSDSSLKVLSNLQDDDINDTHTFAKASNANIQVNGASETTISSIDVNGVEKSFTILNSEIFVIVNEDGSYSIESPKFNALGERESLKISFDYVAIDNSNGNGESKTSEPKTLTLTIQGTNDQPVINSITVTSNNLEHTFSDLEVGEGENKETYQNGKLQGTLSFDVSDEDINDGHKFVSFEKVKATITDETYNTDRTDSPIDVITEDILVSLNEDGSFEITNKNFDNLGFGESVEISFTVQVTDGTTTDHLGNLTDTSKTESSEGTLSQDSSISKLYTVTMTIYGSNDKPTISPIFMGVDTIIYENADNDENDTTDPQDGILRNDEASNSIKGEFVAMDDDFNDAHTFEVLSMENGNETVEVYNNGRGSESSIQVEISDSNVDISLIDIQKIILTNNNFGEEAQDSKTNFELVGDFTALAKGEKATVKFYYQANDNQNDDQGGEASLSDPKVVEITVEGTNDQPVISAITTASVNETTSTNTDNDKEDVLTTYTSSLQAGTTIVGMDEDVNDTHIITAISQTNGNNITIIDGNKTTDAQNPVTFNATVSFSELPENQTLSPDILKDLKVTFTDDLTTEAGKFAFDYTLEGNFNALGAGEKATITFDVLVNDGNDEDSLNETGKSEIKTVTIEITGTNDRPEVVSNLVDGTADFTAIESHDTNPEDGDDTDTILRNEDINSILSGKFITNDEDLTDTHTFTVQNITVEDVNNLGKGSNDAILTATVGGLQVLISSNDILLGNNEITLESIVIDNYDYSVQGKSMADVTLKGNFNALGDGEKAWVFVKYNANDAETSPENSISKDGFIEIEIIGTNDQPVIEQILPQYSLKQSFLDQETLDANNDGIIDKEYEGTAPQASDMIENAGELETILTSITTNAMIDLADITTDKIKEGSAAMYDVTTSAVGEKVVVNWTYTDKGTVDQPDVAFVIVDGEVRIIDSETDMPLEIVFNVPGTHTITFGVVNTTTYASDNSDEDFATSSYLVIEDITSNAVVVFADDFGGVDAINGDGLRISANGSMEGFNDFLNKQEVYFENAVLEGQLLAKVSDEDQTDTHDYVTMDELNTDENSQIVIAETRDGSMVASGDELITTPVRVQLDVDGNYIITSTSFDKMGEGDSVSITFPVKVTDNEGATGEQAISEPVNVTIVINGTNDQPVLESVEVEDAVVYEQTTIESEKDISDLEENENLKEDFFFTGKLKVSVSDEDENDSYTFEEFANIEAKQFDEDDTLMSTWIDGFSVELLNNERGEYKISGDKFNDLASGEKVEISFDVQVNDGTNDANGETNLSNIETVMITVMGINDQPTVTNVIASGSETIDVDMDAPNSANSMTTIISGQFDSSDEDKTDAHEYAITGVENSSDTTMEIDGVTYSVIAVPVLTENDAQVEQANSVNIAIRAYDSSAPIDLSQIKGLSIGVDGDTFKVSGDFEHLPEDAKLDIKFQYIADDLNGFDGTNGRDESSLSEKAWATVTVTGTNDVAEISGLNAREIDEDDSSISGKLFIKDVDAGEKSFQAGNLEFETTKTTFVTPHEGYTEFTEALGVFNIQANGDWTYTLNNGAKESLDEGDKVVETYLVKSIDGTQYPITITINGEEGTPTISGSTTNELSEDVEVVEINGTKYITTTGTLNVDDEDHHESMLSTSKIEFEGAGNPLGILEVTDTDTWEYKVNNDLEIIQSLGQYDESDPSTYIDQTYTLYSKDENANETITIRIKGTNGDPTIEVVDLGSTYVEIDGLDNSSNNVSLVSSVSISDEDGDNIYKAKVIIENASEDDVLLFTNTDSIIGNYVYDEESGKGVLTLTSLSQSGLSAEIFEEAITNVTFDNTAATFESGSRNISFSVEDASTPTSAVAVSPNSATITMTATNDTPELTVITQGGNFIEAITDENAMTTGGEKVSILGNGFRISDFDDENMSEATIELTNIKDDDLLSIEASLPTGIRVDTDNSTDTKIVLVGIASKDSYETAIKSILFSNSSENPNEEDRVITILVNDGETNSSSVQTIVSVQASNDATQVVNDTSKIQEDKIAKGNVITDESDGKNDFDVDDDLSIVSFTIAGMSSITFNASKDEVDVKDENANVIGQLVLDTEGNYTFTPMLNWNGEVPVVTYELNTGSKATLSIFVDAVNDAPTIIDEKDFSIFENANILEDSVEVLDVDTDTLDIIYSLIGDTPSGLTFNSNGTYSFDPSHEAYQSLANGEEKKVTFEWKANDGSLDSVSTDTVTITVTGSNDQPNAKNDIAGTPEFDTSSYIPTDGSVIKFTFETTEENQEVEINWIFSTKDWMPYNDFAVIQVNNSEINLLSDVASLNKANTTGPETNTITFPNPGVQTVIIAISDSHDGVVESKISINSLDAVNNLEVETNGNVQTSEGQYTLSTINGVTDLASYFNEVGNLENNSIIIDVLENDTDVDSTDVLSIKNDFDTTATLLGKENKTGGTITKIIDKGIEKLEFNPGNDFDYLKEGEMQEVIFKYRVDDQEKKGENGIDTHESSYSNWATVSVLLVGTNDAPKAQNIEKGEILETQTEPILINLYEDANVNDVDNDNSSLKLENILIKVNEVELESNLYSLENGVFKINPVDFKNIVDANEKLDIKITYDISDGIDSTSNTATVSILGTNNAPVAGIVTPVTIYEEYLSSPSIDDSTVLTTVSATDIDSSFTFSLQESADYSDKNGKPIFEIDSLSGEVTLSEEGFLALRNSEINDAKFILTVIVTDTDSTEQKDSTTVSITVDDNTITQATVDMQDSSDSKNSFTDNSGNDNYTNQTQPVFDLEVAEDASKVEIIVEGIVHSFANKLEDGTWQISNQKKGTLSLDNEKWTFSIDKDYTDVDGFDNKDPKDYSLKDDTHSFKLRVTDDAGNPNNISEATISFDIDTFAPNTPMTLDLVSIDSTNTYGQNTGADDVTSDNTPTISGTAEANAYIRLYLTNAEDFTATTLNTIFSDRNKLNTAKEISRNSFLNEGDYTGHAVHSWYGNSSTDPEIIKVFVKEGETIKYIAQSANLQLVADIDGAPSNNFMGNPSLWDKSLVSTQAGDAIEITALEDGYIYLGVISGGGSNSTDVYIVSSKEVGSTKADGNGDWSIKTSQLDEGVHNLTATAEDKAGNVSDVSTSLEITIDKTATIGTIDLFASSDSGDSNSDNLTNDTTPTFRVNLGADAKAGDHIELLLNDNPLTNPVTILLSTSNISDGYVYLTVNNGDLGADGVKNISAKFEDIAGNTAQSASLDITLDTAKPSAILELAKADLKVGESTELTITFSEVPYGFDASSNLTIPNGALSNGSFDSSGKIYTATFTPNDNVEDTTNIITLDKSWTDKAGNKPEENSKTSNFVIDTKAPTQTVEITEITNDSGAKDFITNDLDGIVVSGTVTPILSADEKVEISLDGGSTWLDVTSLDKTNGTWTYEDNTSRSDEVSQTYQVRVVDSIGNVGNSDSQEVKFYEAQEVDMIQLYSALNLIQNGSFEDNVTNEEWKHVNQTFVDSWSSSNSQMEIWDNRMGKASDGKQYIELDVHNNSKLDSISQTVNNLKLGEKYLIEFDAASRDEANRGNEFEVIWNGEVVATITEDDMHNYNSKESWTSFSFEVEAKEGDNIIEFKETLSSNDGHGPLLDNIQLSKQTNTSALFDDEDGTGTLKFVNNESSSDSEIDVSKILSNLESNIPNVDEVSEFDLTYGEHILSNINANDVFAMTGDNNVLKITLDDNDTVKLDTAKGWEKKGDDDSDGYTSYIATTSSSNGTDTTVELLINKDDIIL